MDANGQLRDSSSDGQVLRWPGRVLTATDLRSSLNGHAEVQLTPGAIVTPLAAEHLQTRGIRVNRLPAEPKQQLAKSWGYAQQQRYPLVRSAVQALERQGVHLQEMPEMKEASACRWAQALSECIARGDCLGGVVFGPDAGLLCCVANKVSGLRAAAVTNVAQAAKASLTLGANWIAVEMPGRTYFEALQILRTLCAPGMPACPAPLAGTLQELDGHAHR